MAGSSGPLDGVRVIEVASVVLGPWACQVLGDLGADVVKVEPPAGDSNRRVGPARSPLMGALFLTCNRNKRSVVLDAKQPRGRDALVRLIARADVLVHNLRPASLARLGLEYRTLAALNPRLIVCGTCGYGARGPYADRPAYDDSIQAASGVAGLAERLGNDPAFVPTILADKTTALAVVAAVTAALYARERTGQGQAIEVPMFETMVAYLMVEHLYGATFDPPAGRAGYTRLLTPHRRPHRTLDGCLAVLPYLDDHWRAFCEVAGRPDLVADPRFATLDARTEHIEQVYAETGRIVATRSTAEWLERLGAAGVPVTAVRSLDDLLDDEHLLATGFWQVLEATSEGRLRMPGLPMRFESTPGTIRRPPPRLGEHSAEVLREVGLSAEEIEALARDGVTVAGAMEER